MGVEKKLSKELQSGEQNGTEQIKLYKSPAQYNAIADETIEIIFTNIDTRY